MKILLPLIWIAAYLILASALAFNAFNYQRQLTTSNRQLKEALEVIENQREALKHQGDALEQCRASMKEAGKVIEMQRQLLSAK